MFEGTELPIEFDGQPVCVGQQFKFIPNGMIYTVVFKEPTLRFLFKLEREGDDGQQYSNLLSLVKDPKKWERV